MDIATGAIGSILSKLADLLKAEYNLQTGVKEQVESLTRELQSAQAFLQEIDKVPPDQLDNSLVKAWAYEVREASYDMEDILDTFLVHVEGPDQPINKKGKPLELLQEKKSSLFELFGLLQEKVGSFFSETTSHHDIARAIDTIKKRPQEVTDPRDRYTLDSIVTRPSPSSVVDPRLKAMFKQVTQLIGINKPSDELASLLSLSSHQGNNDMSHKKLKIVSVVGVGGLGKTTLAKAVYENLEDQFSCRAFVPVGRNPDLKKVLRDILTELDKNKYRDSSFNTTTLDERQLIDELQDFLQRKRYFIVIDDVCDIPSWETISYALVENNNGSRIIITTRNSEVAAGEVYKLQALSDDSSKDLLYARMFGGEDKCPDNQRQKISEVADKILKKCGGVPLAIITMASYLVGKSMEGWLEVCNSIGFCGKGKEQTSNTEWILSLSYYDLPPHLKTCLLYLGIFPEDYLISKDALIWMWIAEGFVNNGKPGDGLFDIGEGYFNELINRSLIQPVEQEETMTVEGCRVHDMILDLIRSLSREANFAMVLDDGEEVITRSNARRIALQNRVLEDTPQDNCMDTTRARSFIAFRCSFIPRVQLQSFKLLRVLFLDGCSLVGFEHAGDLLHLRCLGIGSSDDRDEYYAELPKEIGDLKFLRVLFLGDMEGLLPSSVGMLTQLVCLHAPWMELPGGIIKDLTSLQELQIYEVEDKSVGQFVKELSNLSELRLLRTDISGRMDERMQSDLLTSLGNLHKLQRLDLVGMLLPRDGFTFHWLPSCIHPSHLPNLSDLSLAVHSLGDQAMEILGGLPELCHLYLLTKGRATLTGTAGRGYFQKLQSFLLIESTAYFVVNEDSSVSLTIWHARRRNDAPAFAPRREQDTCRVAGAIMPNLQALLFEVDVAELTACNNGRCDNLGLEYLPSLQKVFVHLYRRGADADVLEKENAALRHAIQVHPNRPTLKIK